MSKRNKRTGRQVSNSNAIFHPRHLNTGNSEVFRNMFAVEDDIDPVQALSNLQDMFRGKIEADVVEMIFTECAYNVENTLETLMTLSSCSESQRDTTSDVHNPFSKEIWCTPKDIKSSTKCINSDHAQNSGQKVVPCYPEPPNYQNTFKTDSVCKFQKVVAQSSSHPSVNNIVHQAYDPYNMIMTYSTALTKSSGTTENLTKEKDFFFVPKTSLFNPPIKEQNLNFDSRSEHAPMRKRSQSLKSNFNQSNGSDPYNSCNSGIFPEYLSKNNLTNMTQNPHPVYGDKNEFKRSRGFSCNALEMRKVSPICKTTSKSEKFNFFTEKKIIADEVERLKINVLIILRGLPGSGKSTLAEELKYSGTIFSTDNYFYVNGKYKFDGSKLSEAHEWNRIECQKALKRGISPIIVDNTNTEAWEIVPYVKMGLKFKYKMHLLEPNTPWKFVSTILAMKNSHGVTKQKLDNILMRYDHTITIRSLIASLNATNSSIDNRNHTQSSVTRSLNNYGQNHDIKKNEPIVSSCHEGKSKLVNYNENRDSYNEVKLKDIAFSSVVVPDEISDDNDEPKLISLEAVVYREDEMSTPIYSGSNQMENYDKEASLNAHSEEKEISNLADLKILVNEGSDESRSVSQCLNSSDASPEVTAWESITEPDPDFLWSSSSADLDKTSNCNSYETLENDYKGNVKMSSPQVTELYDQIQGILVATNISETNDLLEKEARVLENVSSKYDSTSPKVRDVEDRSLDFCNFNHLEINSAPVKTGSKLSQDSDKLSVSNNETSPVKQVSSNLQNRICKTPTSPSNPIIPKRRIAANFKSLFNDVLDNFHETNWVFPAFKSKDTVPIESTILEKPICVSVGTQIELSDFALLYLTDKLDTKLRTIVPSSTVFSISSITSNSGKDSLYRDTTKHGYFDKSTLTDEVVEDHLDDAEKLQILKDCFPEILEQDLKHLLELCHDDPAWLSSILLEWGYKYNVPTQTVNPLKSETSLQGIGVHKELDSSLCVPISCNDQTSDHDKQTLKCNHESSSESHSDVLQDGNFNMSFEELPNDYMQKTDPSLSDFVYPSFDNGEKSISLTLDPNFALQLEKLFGPLFQSEPKIVSEAHRKVDIDYSIAKLIYEKWKETIVNYDQENFKQKLSDSNNKNAETPKKSKSLQPPDVCSLLKTITKYDHKKEPHSLSEIMDMEYALQAHREEKLKQLMRGKTPEESLAIKLKRSKLYSMYPSIDPVALDEIFESNNFSLDHTAMVVGNGFGESPLDLETDVLNFCSTKDPMEDFSNDSWKDWVYLEEPEKYIESAHDSIDPQVFREDAVFHYQKRHECICKAQRAYYKGMKDVASYYAQKGDFHATKFKEANKQAATLILQDRNKTLSPLTLDLHGLYVQEAIPAMIKYLKKIKDSINQDEHKTVSIITGKGKHSAQSPKLRPSVMNYLSQAGYRYDETNMGIFRITLPSST